MDLVSTLLGSKQRVQIIQKQTVISIDCTVKEIHGRKSPATEFELEDGTSISDGRIVKPHTLQIEGIISDTPISLLGAGITTLASVVAPPVGIVAAAGGVALFKAIAGTKKPSVQAYLQLLDLQESPDPLDVVTTLKRYSNMYITEISAPREASTGQVLVFTLSLSELLLVSPQTVNLKVLQSPAGSAKKANVGKQAPSATEQAYLSGQKAAPQLPPSVAARAGL